MNKQEYKVLVVFRTQKHEGGSVAGHVSHCETLTFESRLMANEAAISLENTYKPYWNVPLFTVNVIRLYL